MCAGGRVDATSVEGKQRNRCMRATVEIGAAGRRPAAGWQPLFPTTEVTSAHSRHRTVPRWPGAKRKGLSGRRSAGGRVWLAPKDLFGRGEAPRSHGHRGGGNEPQSSLRPRTGALPNRECLVLTRKVFPARRAARVRACLQARAGRHRVEAAARLTLQFRPLSLLHYSNSKNPNAPAVKREAEEDWGSWKSRKAKR